MAAVTDNHKCLVIVEGSDKLLFYDLDKKKKITQM